MSEGELQKQWISKQIMLLAMAYEVGSK